MTHDGKKRTQDPRRAALLFLISTIGLVVVVFSAALVKGRWQQRVRGIGPALPGPTDHAAVSPLCVNAALRTDPHLDITLNRIADAGFVWVRQTFPWRDIEPVRDRFDWAPWDLIVRAVADHAAGLRLIAVIDTAPTWATGNDLLRQAQDDTLGQAQDDTLGQAQDDITTPPTDPADLARFAGYLAARYGDRIDYYQIWDEPNLNSHWGGRDVDPAGYAALLQAAAEAIRAHDADGEATILLAGLAPTVETGPRNLSDVRYLRALYDVGAKTYFDIVAAKPYGFDTGPDDRRIDETTLNFARLALLREEMVAHDDEHKALWASHWGWNALPTPSTSSGQDWDGLPSIWGQTDETTQASHTVAALDRAQREWPWAGALCLENWQPAALPNDPRWGFALIDQNGIPRPIYHAIQAWAGQLARQSGYYPATPAAAEYAGDWRFSELGADVSERGEHRARILFKGTDFGLRVRRGDYRAYMFVTIDGQPANALPQDENGAYLVLSSPDVQPQVINVPVARGLSDGPHVAEIRVERGWDQWPLVGWSVGWWPHAEATRYKQTMISLGVLALLCIVGLFGSARRMHWGWAARILAATWSKMSAAARVSITAAVTLIFWASAWLTWGQERAAGSGGVLTTLATATLFTISPIFILSLASLTGLALLVILRLDLGLALVAFAAPFYLQSRPMFDRAFSVVEIALLLCVLSWLVHLARTKDRRAITFRSAHLTLDWAVLFFVIVSAISLFIAANRGVALREFRVIVLEPALFYLILRASGLDRRARWRIVDAFVLGAVGVALVGLYQYFFTADTITAEAGLRRLKSVYGSPNNVGLYLGRALPLLIAVALWGDETRRRWIYGAIALPVGMALLLSFSKGALLFGIPASLLALGLLAGGRWLWAALGTVVAGTLAAVPLLRTPRFTSLFDLHSGTSFFRLNLWRSAVDMIRDHPLLGVGLDNFLYAYRGRYIRPAAWQEPNLSHPHNIVLEYWSRLGVLGLAASLWLQAAFWRLALPLRHLQSAADRALALGLMASMVDFLAHGLVDNSYFAVDLAFAFFMTLGLAVLLSDV